MRTGSCAFCMNSKPISADKKQWLIHLSTHRESMIKCLVECYPSCVLCLNSEPSTATNIFANNQGSSYYRKHSPDYFYDHL